MQDLKRAGALATIALAMAVAQVSADTATIRRGLSVPGYYDAANGFATGYNGVSDTTLYYYNPPDVTPARADFPEVWMRSSNGGYGSMRTSTGGPLSDRNLIRFDLSAFTGKGVTVTGNVSLTIHTQPYASSGGQALDLGYQYKLYEIASGNAGWTEGTTNVAHNGYGAAATTNSNAQNGTPTWFYKSIDTVTNTPYTRAINDTTSVKWLSAQTSLGNMGSNPEGYANTGGLWNWIDLVDQNPATVADSYLNMNANMDPLASATVGTENTDVVLTLPAALVQKWIDNPTANAGMLSRYLALGGYMDTFSSEASSTNIVYRPTLRFDYVVAPPVAGDFNSDGVANAADIDLLMAATQGSVPPALAKFDLTADGNVNSTPGAGSDSDKLVKDILLTTYGDANLDKKVNFDDLLALAQHYSAPTASWSEGDFNNVDGVSFDDLLALAQNYGFGVAGLSQANFDADWALAQSLVPEPTTLALAGLALPMLRRRR